MLNRRRTLIAVASQGRGLPSGYTELEWIRSSNAGQYINTGIYITDDDILNIDFDVILWNTGSILGCGNNPDTGYPGVALINESDIGWRFGNTTIERLGFSFISNKKYNAILQYRKLTLDGIEYNTTYPISWEPMKVPLTLFARNVWNYGILMTMYCRIYKFSITRNNLVIMNLIPALDPNNRPCMFDTVSQAPFYNAGTGEFLYG